MGYIESFTNDIFISYSHIDNLKYSGQTSGWIEQFHNDLRVALFTSIGTNEVNIWWDNSRLDGGIAFDEAIEKSIDSSAIFLCLNSPAFLHSEYCQKELDLFYKKAQKEPYGLRVKDRPRIVNVLLYNIPFENWPFELKGALGFNFHNAKNDERGKPVDVAATEYKIVLNKLTDGLVALIETLRNPPPPPDNKFTIYFGEVSDSLRQDRDNTIAELEEEGYEIITDIPPPLSNDEHQAAVAEAIHRSKLSIHLMDEFPGRPIADAKSNWYIKNQAEISLDLPINKMIWVPKQVDVNTIQNNVYKSFIADLDCGKRTATNLDFVRGVKGELKAQIKELATKIANATAPRPSGEKLCVLLDTHIKDVMYALELSNNLLDKEVKTYINSQDDDPTIKNNTLRQRISQVNKLVFFYGRVSKEWVLGQMNEALKMILENNYAVEDFFVFMVPPHKEKDEINLKQRFLNIKVLNYSDQSTLDAGLVDDFFNNIRS